MATIKLACWNVNGIRAAYKKGFIDWLTQYQPDILGLQETKISADQLTFDLTTPHPDYKTYWSFAEKRGYSGTALLTKETPNTIHHGMGIDCFDNEGRIVQADYGDFVYFTVYFPNGTKDNDRLQYKMAFYDAFLNHLSDLKASGRSIIVCGDVNTAHRPIDLARPKDNENVSGFLPIERAWIDQWLEAGFVDTFRHFHPDATDRYSWWHMRSRARDRNVGWRIDYFMVSDDLVPRLVSADILSDVMGSDHCPITLELAR